MEWSEAKNVAWKLRIPGDGSGTPVVWADTIFVQTAIPTHRRVSAGEEAGLERRRRELASRGRPRNMPVEVLRFTLLAVDRETGQTRWQRVAREARPREAVHSTNSWSSGSAVTDGAHVFAYFGSHGLYCYDLEGNLTWRADFGDKRQLLELGEGSSPALFEDKIVVQWDHEGQSFIVALDKSTGRELWRRDRGERTSWATPLVVAHGGGAQVITVADRKIRSYDLETGAPVWTAQSRQDNFIATPVAAEGRVYLTASAGGRRAYVAVELDRARGEITETDAILWSYQRDASYVPSPLLHDGVLYFLKGDDGILSSLDAASGQKHYGPVRLPGMWTVYASPVGVGDRVYIAGRDGQVAVLSHGSEFELLAINSLDDGFDASPVVVGDDLYLRGHEHLYRVSRE